MVKVAAEVGATANSYQILGRLAVGGMAEIFLARGAGVTGVERHCVLKRILRELANDAQFVQMFIDEARLAAQLQHPNIASVYDIGMLGDSYFFTMEYVHGETVRSLLQRAQGGRRSLPLACVLTIIAGTAAGLHHAHERNGSDGRHLGIVHRDISPSNVMVSYEGNVKIVDFGVAKADDRAVKTRSGIVKGKISYLSPEQCRGARVDRRSDLFSLGIVMWEMLTGARLYRRDSDFDNMAAIVHEAAPPPSSRRPEVPRAVDEIVLRLLAKSPSDRFQTAGEVVEAIENASLRAGTILSMSAVSRLIREMFGARAEPWLQLDSEPMQRHPITLGARPIAEQGPPIAADPAEAELAAVADLSGSSASTDRDGPAIESPRVPARAASAGDDPPASPSLSTWKDSPRAVAARGADRGPDRAPDRAPRSRRADLDAAAAVPAPAPARRPSVPLDVIAPGRRPSVPPDPIASAPAPARQPPVAPNPIAPGRRPSTPPDPIASAPAPARRPSVAPDSIVPAPAPARRPSVPPDSIVPAPAPARPSVPPDAIAPGRRPSVPPDPIASAPAPARQPSVAPDVIAPVGRPSPSPRVAVTSRMAGAAVSPHRAAPSAPHPRSGHAAAPSALASATQMRGSVRIEIIHPPVIAVPATAQTPVSSATEPPADRAALALRNTRIARLGSPSLDDVVGDRRTASVPAPAWPAARTETVATPPDARPVARSRDAQHRRISRTRRVAVICAIGGALGGVAVWLSAASREDPAPVPSAERAGAGALAREAPPPREATPPRAAAPAPPDVGGVRDMRGAGEASAVAVRDAGDGNEIAAAAAATVPAPIPTDASPTAPRRRAHHSPDGAPPLQLPLPSSPMMAGEATAAPSSSKALPAAADGAPAPPPYPSEQPSPEALNSLFHLGEYAGILRACSATAMTADIVAVCILAACNLEAADKLTLWLPLVSEERRAVIVARCDQLSRSEAPVASAPGRDGAEGSGGAQRPVPP